MPLLVTGVSGVAGYNALPYLQARYPGQVIGIRQRDNWRLSGPGIEICDAEDRGRLEELFDQYRFAAVLDCAGNCALKSCELDPAMAWRINVDGVRNLLEISLQHRARLVHLSIDLVFSGQEKVSDTFPAVVMSRPIRPTRLPSTAKRWSPPRK